MSCDTVTGSRRDGKTRLMETLLSSSRRDEEEEEEEEQRDGVRICRKQRQACRQPPRRAVIPEDRRRFHAVRVMAAYL